MPKFYFKLKVAMERLVSVEAADAEEAEAEMEAYGNRVHLADCYPADVMFENVSPASLADTQVNTRIKVNSVSHRSQQNKVQ